MNNMEDERPLVSICCLTYNHASFLHKTLEGFCAQRTNFPFEIIIHDDCSTDGTRKLLEEFRDSYDGRLTLLLEEENQFSKGVNIAFDIMRKHVCGKYAAICEGDDWWTDSDKLQMQVDLMETTPDCMLTLHNGIRHNCKTGENELINSFSKEGFLNEEDNYMAFMNNPPTASFVIRMDVLENYPEYLREAPVFDDVIRLYCYDKGRIYYFDRVMCCRTVMHSDSWNTLLNESPSLYEDYVVRILEFYRRHDQHTNYRHNSQICVVCRKIGNRFRHIYGKKIKPEIKKKIEELSGVTMEGLE